MQNFKIEFENIKNKLPVIIRRLLFSIPTVIIIAFVTLLLCFAEGDDGTRLTLVQIIVIGIGFYVVYLIPINIILRFIQAKMNHIKFLPFLMYPQNFTIDTLHDSKEMLSLLYPSVPIIIPKSYKKTVKEVKSVLQKRQESAIHYADIANKTCDENEFYTAINNCLSTLEWMQQFEKYGVFVAGNTPSDDIRTLKEEMPLYEENLRKRISNQISSQKVEYDIDNMDGHTFEYYCADILRKNRFENVEVTQGSGDHGIDILAEKDGITYAIQCKCYSSNIGNAAVQQAHTGKSLYHKDIAVVLTNQHFTAQAKEEASALGVKLWDREYLTNIIANAEN